MQLIVEADSCPPGSFALVRQVRAATDHAINGCGKVNPLPIAIA